MKKFMAVALLVAAAMFALAPVVYAAEAKGTVKAVDSGAGTLSVDAAGQTVELAAGPEAKAKLEGLKAGDAVTVTYEAKEGKNMISDIAK